MRLTSPNCLFCGIRDFRISSKSVKKVKFNETHVKTTKDLAFVAAHVRTITPGLTRISVRGVPPQIYDT